MPSVLVSTDFSAASAHALDYTCALLRGKNISLHILHILPVAVAYSSDAVALVAMQDLVVSSHERLKSEMERLRSSCNDDLKITGRVETGGFLNTLRQEILRIRPMFVMVGTRGFSDFYIADTDPLDALHLMPAPVLFVPLGAEIRPIRKVVFACHFSASGKKAPIEQMIAFVQFTGAAFQVVDTDPAAVSTGDGEQYLKEGFSELKAQFHRPRFPDLVTGISRYITENDIDCLLVIPRRYGIWQNFFGQNRTKALARANRIPLVAFRPADG